MRLLQFLIWMLPVLFSPTLSWANGAKTSAPKVCSYVAEAYNNGQERSFFKPFKNPVDIFNNGKPVNVQIIPEGNHGGNNLGIGEPDKNGWLNSYEGYDPNGLWKLDQIFVVSFEGRNYVVAQQDRGPIDVTDLGIGNICRFRWTWKATIEENHDPALCKRVANEERFEKLDFETASAEVKPGKSYNFTPIDLSDGGRVMLNHTAFIDLDNSGKPSLIGELIYMLPGIYGQVTWLGFIKNGQVSEDRQSQELLYTEEQFVKDDSGQITIFPVRIEGKNYIEADHRLRFNQLTPPRELWRITNQKIETVCSISEAVKFSPTQAYDTMAPREGAQELFTLSVGSQRDIFDREEQMKKHSPKVPAND